MRYLDQCKEWDLLQTLGSLITEKTSKFKSYPLDTSNTKLDTVRVSNFETELLEVGLRYTFLICRTHALPMAEFNEFESKAKGLCEALDRIVHPRVRQIAETGTETSYARLRSLIEMLEDSSPDETFELLLASGSGKTLFMPPKDSDELERIRTLASDYIFSLTRLAAPPARDSRIPSRSRRETRNLRESWADLRLRRLANSALEAIFERLGCGTDHEVMLKISNDTLTHDLAISTLNLKLSLCPDLNSVSGPWLEVRWGSIMDSSRDVSVTTIQDLCHDLKNRSSQQEELILLIKHDELLGAWVPLHPSQRSSISQEENLYMLILSGAFKPLDRQILFKEHPRRRYKSQEKRALAVLLGYCLMDFFDTGLNSQRIYFLGRTRASPSRNRSETLYLSFNSPLPTICDTENITLGHPTLLSFTKLLLEIDYGQSIDLPVSYEHDETINEATWGKLCVMVDQLEEERNDSYVQAVKGCLTAHKQISKALRSDDNTEHDAEVIVRQVLYEEIVQKLETALADATPRTGKKRQRSESPKPVPRKKPDREDRDTQPPSSRDWYGVHENSSSQRLVERSDHAWPTKRAFMSSRRFDCEEKANGIPGRIEGYLL